MARMRYAIYHILLNVPATGTLTVEASGLLRDILPDQAFRVHWLEMGVTMSLEAGDSAAVTLGKNIVLAPTVVSGALTVLHGVLARFAPVKVVAAATMEGFHEVVTFPEPLDFDQDDSLNMRVDGTNSAATAQQATGMVVLGYEVG